MFFVLDDDRKRLDWFRSVLGEQLDTASSVAEALLKLRGNQYQLIFLDHDLAVGTDPEATGYHLAEVMEREQLQPGVPVIIQSMNPVGAANIQRALSRSRGNVAVVPYSVLRARLEQRLDFGAEK